MEEGSMGDPESQGQTEISLLDLLVVLAESWMILLMGPLLFGALAFAFAQGQPGSFESKVSLRISLAEVRALEPEKLIEAAIAGAGLGVSASQVTAGFALDGVGSTETSVITLRLPQRAEVQLALAAVAAEIDRAASEKIVAARRHEAEVRLGAIADARTIRMRAISKLDGILDRAPSDEASDISAVASVGSTLSLLLSDNERSVGIQSDLQQQLAKLPTTFIETSPTVATAVSARSPMTVAVVTAVAAGFVLLVFVFVRHAFRRAISDARSATKISRIKRAFWMGQKG